MNVSTTDLRFYDAAMAEAGLEIAAGPGLDRPVIADSIRESLIEATADRRYYDAALAEAGLAITAGPATTKADQRFYEAALAEAGLAITAGHIPEVGSMQVP